MEIHIYSVKAKSQAGNIHDQHKKAKATRYSARDFKISAFCWKIQQRASGPGVKASEVR